jgi:N-acetyl-gamma-glutamyl-phosphate reductase
MIRVAIVGARGYTGKELLKILLAHSRADVTCLTARMEGSSKKIAEIFPSLLGQTDLECRDFDVQEVAQKSDMVFLALPHRTSLRFVPKLLEMGKRVIDLSADFRFDNIDTYERWYGPEHTPQSESLLREAVYGLPELYKERIKHARLVANPGCYPTGVILGLAPILREGLASDQSIIVDSKSGISGAGRAPELQTHYPECNENIKAYNIVSHRHMPEMVQELAKLTQKPIKVSFVPHLVPMNRGILNTMYLSLLKGGKQVEILNLYRDFYKDEPFVRVLEGNLLPETKNVAGSNYCDVALRVDGEAGMAIVVSALDNLVKGASGQAVQNMNIMCGFDETAGLNFFGT